MPLETAPASSESTGRWRITYLPLTADPLSVADLEGEDAVPLTYSFTPDGFNWTTTQATVADPRLTLAQDLSRPGKVTETLEVKYVDSVDANSAAVILTQGTEGYLVLRRLVPNETIHTVAQKVYVLKFSAGLQRPDAPTDGGIDTISQILSLTGSTQRKVSLAA